MHGFINNFVQAAVPHDDGHYDHWSMLKENFVLSEKYWPIVEVGLENQKTLRLWWKLKNYIELEARMLKDLKVKNYIYDH